MYSNEFCAEFGRQIAIDDIEIDEGIKLDGTTKLELDTTFVCIHLFLAICCLLLLSTLLCQMPLIYLPSPLTALRLN